MSDNAVVTPDKSVEPKPAVAAPAPVLAATGVGGDSSAQLLDVMQANKKHLGCIGEATAKVLADNKNNVDALGAEVARQNLVVMREEATVGRKENVASEAVDKSLAAVRSYVIINGFDAARGKLGLDDQRTKELEGKLLKDSLGLTSDKLAALAQGKPDYVAGTIALAKDVHELLPGKTPTDPKRTALAAEVSDILQKDWNGSLSKADREACPIYRQLKAVGVAEVWEKEYRAQQPAAFFGNSKDTIDAAKKEAESACNAKSDLALGDANPLATACVDLATARAELTKVKSEVNVPAAEKARNEAQAALPAKNLESVVEAFSMIDRSKLTADGLVEALKPITDPELRTTAAVAAVLGKEGAMASYNMLEVDGKKQSAKAMAAAITDVASAQKFIDFCSPKLVAAPAPEPVPVAKSAPVVPPAPAPTATIQAPVATGSTAGPTGDPVKILDTSGHINKVVAKEIALKLENGDKKAAEKLVHEAEVYNKYKDIFNKREPEPGQDKKWSNPEYKDKMDRVAAALNGHVTNQDDVATAEAALRKAAEVKGVEVGALGFHIGARKGGFLGIVPTVRFGADNAGDLLPGAHKIGTGTKTGNHLNHLSQVEQAKALMPVAQDVLDPAMHGNEAARNNLSTDALKLIKLDEEMRQKPSHAKEIQAEINKIYTRWDNKGKHHDTNMTAELDATKKFLLTGELPSDKLMGEANRLAAEDMMAKSKDPIVRQVREHKGTLEGGIVQAQVFTHVGESGYLGSVGFGVGSGSGRIDAVRSTVIVSGSGVGQAQASTATASTAPLGPVAPNLVTPGLSMTEQVPPPQAAGPILPPGQAPVGSPAPAAEPAAAPAVATTRTVSTGGTIEQVYSKTYSKEFGKSVGYVELEKFAKKYLEELQAGHINKASEVLAGTINSAAEKFHHYCNYEPADSFKEQKDTAGNSFLSREGFGVMHDVHNAAELLNNGEKLPLTAFKMAEARYFDKGLRRGVFREGISGGFEIGLPGYEGPVARHIEKESAGHMEATVPSGRRLRRGTHVTPVPVNPS